MDSIERERSEALTRKLQEMNFNNLIDNDSDDIMQFVDSVLKAEALLDEDNRIKPDVYVDVNLERETHYDMTDGDSTSPSTSHCDKTVSSTDKKTLKRKHPDSDSNTNQVKTLGDCSVCLEPLAGREIGSTLCGHIFCMGCLNNIAVQLKKCPTCRKKVLRSKIIRLYL